MLCFEAGRESSLKSEDPADSPGMGAVLHTSLQPPASQASLLPLPPKLPGFTPSQNLIYLPKAYFTPCSFCLRTPAPFLHLAK